LWAGWQGSGSRQKLPVENNRWPSVEVGVGGGGGGGGGGVGGGTCQADIIIQIRTFFFPTGKAETLSSNKKYRSKKQVDRCN